MRREKADASAIHASRLTPSHLNPIRLNLIIQRLPADPQTLGRFELVAASFFEHLDDGVALDAFQQSEIRVGTTIRGATRVGNRQIARIDLVPFTQENVTLNFILQLANVTRPFEVR